MAATKVFKFPKSMAICADKLYELKNHRLSEQKKVDAIELEEKALKEYIIENLPKSEASGASGKIARVTVVTKEVPQVSDWDKFYAHIKKTGDFELLGRTISKAAIQDRWEHKKLVPGVETFQAVTISINKV